MIYEPQTRKITSSIKILATLGTQSIQANITGE